MSFLNGLQVWIVSDGGPIACYQDSDMAYAHAQRIGGQAYPLKITGKESPEFGMFGTCLWCFKYKPKEAQHGIPPAGVTCSVCCGRTRNHDEGLHPDAQQPKTEAQTNQMKKEVKEGQGS